MIDDALLKMHLEAFVPLEIKELERQGGVTDWHIEEARRRIATLQVPEASEALFFAVVQGRTRRSMSILVECMAVLAFIPGGITAFGMHFEAKLEETTMSEEQQRRVRELIAGALYNDAANHKQWYLWRLVETLDIDLSDQWSEEYPEPEPGVAP